LYLNPPDKALVLSIDEKEGEARDFGNGIPKKLL
jgi:hypothetical protein